VRWGKAGSSDVCGGNDDVCYLQFDKVIHASLAVFEAAEQQAAIHSNEPENRVQPDAAYK
jgi:hypothetical protein